MKKLIINADDFGLHETINRGIIRGHTAGCITSTSLMPAGSAFASAVDLSAKHPELGIGIHLTLVGAPPVLPAEQIPSLVDDDGLLQANYGQFLQRYILGKISLVQVRRELEAQITKVLAAGVKVTHLDSHQHLHIVPGIIDIVLDLANQYNINAIRISDEPYFFTGGYPVELGRLIGRCGLTFLARLARRKALGRRLKTPNAFFGMLAGGNMQPRYLVNIINQLPSGVSEIMMHPGESDVLNASYRWNYHWYDELTAVLSADTKAALWANGVELVSFRELTHD